MNEDQARRLVKACRALIDNAGYAESARGRVKCMLQDIEAIEEVLDDLSESYIQACKRLNEDG